MDIKTAMPPASTQYGVEDRPPTALTVFSAFQHLALIAPIGLVFPLLVARRAGADQATINAVLSSSMLALGIASLLQCGRWRGVGSGFFSPAIFTAAYLPASLVAAERGGLPLVFGMTMFAGACEVVMSRGLHKLRPYLPTEIAGLAVTMIGVILGTLSFQLLFGPAAGGTTTTASAATPITVIGVFSLAAIIVVSIWGPQKLRIYAVLISLAVAWAVSVAIGAVDFAQVRSGFSEWPFGLPHLQPTLPKFEPGLAFEFAIAALAAALRTVGDITTCQKINDPNWLRPEMASIKRGVLADGLGTIIAGALGTVGLNTFSGSIGLSAATGVLARRVGFATGIIFIVLAFIPGAIALAASIPLPVAGAILMFAACFILLNGMQVILSRLLDNRKILVIGLGLILGLSRAIYPGFFEQIPSPVSSLVAAPLVIALLVAIVLNLVFRIGVGSKAQLTVVPGAAALDQVHEFCEAQGGAWGARRDVMHRVTAALVEFAESSGELVEPGCEATIELAFDEYHIDATIRYAGRAMEKPGGGAADSAPEIMATGELPSHIPLLIIGRMADKSSTGHQGGKQWLKLNFVH